MTDFISAKRFEEGPIVAETVSTVWGITGSKIYLSTSCCRYSRWRKIKRDEYSELLNIKTSKIAFYPKSSCSFSVASRCVSSTSVLHVMNLSS